MRLFSQVAALSILAGGVALHADTFRYDLNFSFAGVDTASATFTTSALITADTTVSASGTSSEGPVLSVAVYVAGDCPFSGDFACFDIEEGASGQRLFLTSLPTTTGIFPDVFEDGSVTITHLGGTPPPSPVPEPSTVALLVTGVLGGLGAIRRRLA